MRHPQPPTDRPSTRALIALAVTYAVAAGLNGGLAVLTATWWLGVLAVVLTAVAAAFAIAARRQARRVRLPGPPSAIRREGPTRQNTLSRDADPTRA